MAKKAQKGKPAKKAAKPAKKAVAKKPAKKKINKKKIGYKEASYLSDKAMKSACTDIGTSRQYSLVIVSKKGVQPVDVFEGEEERHEANLESLLDQLAV